DFDVGDMVWLNAKNLTTKQPSKKLDHKRIGPFKIMKKVSSHAFRLELPAGLCFIHPVFHVSLLNKHDTNTIPNRTQPPPLPVEIDGTTEYEVSAILDSHLNRRKLHYLVQWKGYDNQGYDGHTESVSWEPADNVKNAPALVTEFHARYPTKPRPT